MATCQIHIHTKHLIKECDREAWENDPEGLCLLHSRLADKDKNGDFTEAVRAKLSHEDYDFQGVFFPVPFILFDLTSQEEFNFTKTADFRWAVLFEQADFRRAIFLAGADFFHATFTMASFRMTTFIGADFSGSIFSELADFRRANFQGKSAFRAATFDEVLFRGATLIDAKFPGTTFKSADFCGATIRNIDFFEITLKEGAAFVEAIFDGKASFVRINNREEEKTPELDFTGDDFLGATLTNEASLMFQELSLSRATFSGINMRNLVLRNVDWYSHHPQVGNYIIEKLPTRWQKWFRGRQAVFDEILLRDITRETLDMILKYGWRATVRARLYLPAVTPKSYDRVEELYRGLKLNYREAGDFKRVGDFHYGEMEMHRLASPCGGFRCTGTISTSS